MPQKLENQTRSDGGLSAIEAEIMAEKASALGNAGRAVEAALARLSSLETPLDAARDALLQEAAEVVWRFLVQREAIGLRDTTAVIRDYGIPRAVMVRMGAAHKPTP